MSRSTTPAAERGFRPPAAAPRVRPVEPDARARSPVAVLFITVFLDLVGFGIVIPLMPLYAGQFGAGPVAVTWLLAVYSLMQFFFAPWWGRLSDRIGRRPVLLVGIAGASLSYLAFGFAGSLTALFVARAVNGVMGANVGVAQAYIADVTRPEDRAKGMGMIGAAFGLGFIFGPAIGGLLSRIDPSAPFVAAGVLAAINFVLAYFRLPESLPAHVRATTPPREGGLRARLATVVGASPTLRGLYATSFITTLALAGMEATLALWAFSRWRLDQESVGYGFAIMGIVAVLAQGLMVGRLVKRVGERRSAMLGLVLVAVGMAFIALAPSLPLVLAAAAVFAIGQGATVPSVSAMVSHQGGPAEQGRLLAASQSLSAMARVLGPWWGGLAFAYVGISAPYLGAAALSLFALALLASSARAR